MIGAIEKHIMTQHRANEASQRVATIPGIGVLGASAVTATLTDAKAFRSGCDFAPWIGLVPRQDSTGGKQKLGPISKQEDRYQRRLLVVGAHAVLRRAKQSPQNYPWLAQLLARRRFKVWADTATKYRLPPEESKSRLVVPSKRAATAPASERADYKGPTVLPLRLAGPWSPWAVQPAPHWPSPDPAP
jgi:Transposase IS116/IS110/IS902 family